MFNFLDQDMWMPLNHSWLFLVILKVSLWAKIILDIPLFKIAYIIGAARSSFVL